MELFENPRGTRLAGYAGDRWSANARGLVLGKDEDALLAGFRRRPGAQAWIGEHVGKWIDAARRVADVAADPLLESKIARVVEGLLATQEGDGYLGTYAHADRWTAWDVWVHKYALLGLTAQARSRGCEASLQGARRIVELLSHRFRGNVEELFSERVSTHGGMAAGSVIGALAHFHALAGDAPSLELAAAIARGMESERGPRIASSLLEHGDVTRVANGKAYELLSCLLGLVKLDAFAPDPRWLAAAEAAYRDIVAHHRYPSGGSSHHEYYTHRSCWSEAGAVSETCVVVTWIELCDALWRRTARAEYLDEIQRAWMNALLAAQRPDGAAFCYFTPLAGTKAYDAGITCCSSSGARGIAMAPRWFSRWSGSTLEFLSFAPGEASELRPDGPVRLAAFGDFALGEPCRIRVTGNSREPRALRVRKPGPGCALHVATAGAVAREDEGGYEIACAGRGEVEVVLRWNAPLERIAGSGMQRGRTWLWRAPWLLSADDALSALEVREPPEELGPWLRSPLLEQPRCIARDAMGRETALVAFAEAGRSGSRFRSTWPATAAPSEPALASASGAGWRRGRLDGLDADVLWSARAAPGAEVEFALELEPPRRVRAVVFRHAVPQWDVPGFAVGAGAAGDAAGPGEIGPRVEVRLARSGAWTEVARLPPLPRGGAPALRVDPPHGFERRVAFDPVLCWAVRVAGIAPATGEVFCAGLCVEID